MTMARRICSFVACALAAMAICVGLLPAEARAAGNAPRRLVIGNVTVDTSQGGYWTTDSTTGELTESSAGESWNVHYDAGSNTLTLNGATISGSGSENPSTNYSNAAIYADSKGQPVSLAIVLEGANTVSASVGVFVWSETGAASLAITGPGSLNASCFQIGILVQSNGNNAALTIRDADVEAAVTSAAGDGITVQMGINSDASLTVDGGSLTAAGNGDSGTGVRFQFGSGVSGSGTPGLTVNGNTVVRANGGIASNSSPVTPNGTGIVFNNGTGTVYGNVTLQDNLEVGKDESLTIPGGASLTIPNGLTLTNRGTVTIEGGALTNDGVIENHGTLPNSIGGNGTVSHIPEYTFSYPQTRTLAEDHGSGFYTAKGTLSLGSNPVLTGGGRVVVYGTNKADFNTLTLSKDDDPTKTIPVGISAQQQGSGDGVYLKNPEETRVFAVLGADEAADFSVLCEIHNMEKVPSGQYSGTICLYVGYTTDGTVKAGDAANDVNLSQLDRYEVEVNLSVGHVHSPAAAWLSDAGGHWHACSGCADKLDYESHAPKTVNAKAATCTEDGYTGDTVCSVCGYKISRGESVPALGHDWGEWTVSEPATCTDDGMEERSCATCGVTEERTLPALGHDWGKPEWSWSEDGAKFVATFACAHDAAHARELTAEPTSSVRAEPACTEAGVRIYTATVELDGAKYTATSEQAIPALGHDFQDGVCTRCGEKDPDYVAPAGTDETQKPEPESDELPNAGDASLPALAAAVAGSLLCLVAAPRLRRR